MFWLKVSSWMKMFYSVEASPQSPIIPLQSGSNNMYHISIFNYQREQD